jgi:uncharacterized protein
MSHTLVHFEIPADDVDKLKKFYSSVFGWNTVDIPQMEYVMLQTVPTDEKGMLKEPGINGGLYKRTSKEQVPVNYVNVESVDDFIERAIKNGGKLLAPKTHVPTVGDIAWIADPEGNPVGLIRPEM